jgi:ADP-ribose pyrophosphatase
MRIKKDAQKLTDLKWLNMFNVDYIDKSGRQRTWQVATRNTPPKCISGDFASPDAVVIVPYHIHKEKVVITKEYRVPLADVEYGFPAGLVDPGESVEETVRRELMEETGLTVSRIVRSSPVLYSSAGMTDESVAIVYVECTGEVSTAGNEGSEQIEVLFVSAEQAGALCRDTTLKFDAKAWPVLWGYARHGDF